MSLGQIFVAAAEMNTEIIFGISTEYANVLCWADGGILIKIDFLSKEMKVVPRSKFSDSYPLIEKVRLSDHGLREYKFEILSCV